VVHRFAQQEGKTEGRAYQAVLFAGEGAGEDLGTWPRRQRRPPRRRHGPRASERERARALGPGAVVDEEKQVAAYRQRQLGSV
jgi:hypothetical protein